MRNKRYPLSGERVTLGRSSQADIPLEDDLVSRFHARILYVNFERENEIPDCRLFDEKSTNGTYVNGGRVDPEGTWLADRDRIKIGETVFGFFIRDEDELSLDGQLQAEATREELHLTYNPLLFSARLETKFEESVRSRKPLSALVFSIDQRDEFARRFGKLCGESLLREVAKIFHENRRPQDVTLRFEEDKIVILAPGTETRSALRIAKGLEKKVSETKFGLEEEKVELTLTGGVVDSRDPAVDSSDTLIQNALHALERRSEGKLK